jgi:glyoxylase-like metal-dependent hydrolase (beta-lactamase superfamily II)
VTDEIAPGVFVATSPVYLTTTTIVVGAGGGCLLIDPALTPAELDGLGEWLASAGLRPAVAWATHPHWDHVLWSRSLGTCAPRYATATAATAARESLDDMIAEAESAAPGHDRGLLGRMLAVPGPGDSIPWDGPQARLIAHEGHAPGHAAVWLPGSGVLVAGDMLSDVEIPLLDTAAADPVGGYRAGLDLLEGVTGVRLVVPGHGHVADASALRARIAMDRGYLDALQAGQDAPDPRLLGPAAAWLRAEHRRQQGIIRSARGRRPG